VPPPSRPLAILTAVAAVYALKLSSAVTLPLAFALFLIALLWPLQSGLERRLPRTAAFVTTVLVLFVALGLFGWILAACAEEAIDRWPRYEPRFEELKRTWGARLEGLGLAGGGAGAQQGEGAPGGSAGVAGRGAKAAVAFVEGGLLTLALAVLGLLEVRSFRDKLVSAFGGSAGGRLADSARQASSRFGRYFATRTVLGAIQGVATALFAWAVGLDLALVWGVTSALLNYVPTIGSALAVIPPALFALVQFPTPGKALMVAGGLAAVQIVLGNYVDPRIQGRRLSLSPFVVLLAVSFWGWVWGPGGALIAVPIVIALVILGQEFDALRPAAVLLSGESDDEEGAGRERAKK
jgi:predicted PurR-regulated permease PerM